MGWLDGWQYRKSHEIEGSSAGAQTDYQIKIKIHYGSGTDSDEDVYLNEKCRSDFGDIRFTKDDGETLLDYWMEEKTDSDYAIFWVKIPSIPASPDSTTIYIYYGKSDATYVGSGSDTFPIFYEDFETWEGWTQYGSGQVSQDSARAFEGTYSAHKTNANDPNGAYKEIGQTLGRNIALEFRVNRNSGYSGGSWDRIGLLNAGDDGYGWAYDHGGDQIAIDKRTDYSGTQYGKVSATDEMDAWVKGILKIYGDTIKAERYLSDGTKAGETTLTDTDYTDFNRVYIFGGYDYWVDQMFIRKYVDPEPSHGSWGSEEEAPPPTVSTQDASDITTDSATLNGSVDAINDDEIVERGFEWGTESGNYTDSWTETGSFGAESFSHQITNLSPNTTYYYRAKAKNSLGEWGYGEEKSFTTPAPPTVTTESASDVTHNSAKLNGSVTAINDSEIVERGFEWGTESGVYDNEWTETGSFGTGSFSHDLSGLNPETTYYYRAKAKNNDGVWGYGDEVSFTTSSAPPPTVSTKDATNISASSATLNGSVDAINDTEITERGFEWGTEPGNYPNSWTETGSFGTGDFSHVLNSLSPNTTYYYRAKAKNNYDVWGYGEEKSFTTSGSPSVSTLEPIVSTHSVTLKGSVDVINDSKITEYGFEWGTEPGVYTDSWTKSGDFGIGEFSHILNNLPPGTTYYYRAKAKNDNGYWGYGEEVSFTTDPPIFQEGFNIIDFSFTKTLREYANYIIVRGFVAQPGDHDSWTESLDGWQIYDGSNWVNASDGGATLSSERMAGSYSLKFPASAQKMRYPSSLDLDLDGSIYSGFDCFFGNESGEDIMVTIKIYENEDNYFLISQPVRKVGEAETVNWTQVSFIAPNITIVRKCETDPLDSSNLLDDPSFETWPTNWTLTGDITQHNITRTGSYSVKTTSLGSISQVLENAPEVIWIGCWRAGASEKSEDYLTIKVEWLNEDDEVVDTAEYTAGGPFPSSWQKVGPIAFERPATAVKAKIIYTLYSCDGNDKYIDDAFAYTFPNINWIEIEKDKEQPLYVDNLHLCNWRTVTVKDDAGISKYGKREHKEEKNPAGTYEDLQNYANDLLTEKTSLDYEIMVTSYIPSNVWIWHGDVVHVIIPSLNIDQNYFVEQVEYDLVENKMTLTLVKLLTRLSMLFLR